MLGQLAGQLALLLAASSRRACRRARRGPRCAFFGSPSRLASGLPVAARDSAAAERRQRRRPLLVGRVDLGADVALDRAEPREVDVEVVGPRRAAGAARSRSSWASRVRGSSASLPLRLELLGELVESLGLPLRGLLDLLLLGDDRILRVRQEQHRDEQEQPRRAAATGRSPREPGSEQVGGRGPQSRERHRPLPADEAVGLGGLVEGGPSQGRASPSATPSGSGRPMPGSRPPARGRSRPGRRGRPRRRPRAPSRRATAGRGRRRPASRARRRAGWRRRRSAPHGDGDEPGDGPQDELRDDDAAPGRSRPDGRCGAATAGGGAARRPARTASSAGPAGRRGRAAGSGGMYSAHGRRGLAGARRVGRRSHHAGVSASVRRPRAAPSRQRRVGETSWTESSRQITTEQDPARRRRSSARTRRGTRRTATTSLGRRWPPLPTPSAGRRCLGRPSFDRRRHRRRRAAIPRNRHRPPARSATGRRSVDGMIPFWFGTSARSIEHHPPNEVSVPHSTSACAMNGFTIGERPRRAALDRSGRHGRRPRAPSPAQKIEHEQRPDASARARRRS